MPLTTRDTVAMETRARLATSWMFVLTWRRFLRAVPGRLIGKGIVPFSWFFSRTSKGKSAENPVQFRVCVY
jgi:hypothetical protein